MSKTILIGLNEINFDFLEVYMKKGELRHFSALLEGSRIIKTVSESKYELLEPWIQWVTIHTGKSYDEHQIFRLGDIVEHQDLNQIFEELENKGKTVGAVSPFNVDNRLKNAKFFIPDPWTKTKVTGNWFIKNLYAAIHQSVNDNAQEKISFKSLLALGWAFLFYVPLGNYKTYFSNLLNRKKPGVKAIILDNLLTDVFVKLWRRNKPDFSNIFLNSGAHIQHHYLFNSEAYTGDLNNPEWYCPKGWDPLIKVLKVYDTFLGKLRKEKDLKIFIATGLHQRPHQKITFYWRLKDHAQFMNAIGVNDYAEILPRMSRDFLVNFNNSDAAKNAETILESFVSTSDQQKIFNIDNRGDSLFVELVYPNDIKTGHAIYSKLINKEISDFKPFVSFVAIKNGEHDGIGYLTSNIPMQVADEIALKEVKDILVAETLS